MKSIEEGQVTHILADARARLRSADGNLVLDFSAVRRLDTHALSALENLLAMAEQQQAAIALRGVTVEVYRVLKAVCLASRLTFVN